MTPEPKQSTDESTQQPHSDELWTLYQEHDFGQYTGNGRLALVRIEEPCDVGTDHNLDYIEGWNPDEQHFLGEIQYDTAHDGGLEGMTISPIPRSTLHAKLPDEEVTVKYKQCIDLMLDHLTHKEVAEALDGEPSYVTAGRRGYEAARFVVLDGIDSAIEQSSRLQGHGPSRYARTVEHIIEGTPKWVKKNVLRSERNIWEGGMSFTEDEATRIVELLKLEESHVSQDHEDEITELVNEYNLPYDEYIRGHFTAHDCPSCGDELIERPKEEYGYIHLDCSNCDKQYEGVVQENSLVVEKEISDVEAE